MTSDRIIGLDIVRAIAITLVVINHSTAILVPLSTLPGIGGIVHKLIEMTEPFGLLGVELFFVLSGFLIGSILIRIFMNAPTYGPGQIVPFLVRRWFRTIPAYWLILLLNFLVYTGLGLRSFDYDYLKFIIFIQNLWYHPPLFFPESWSLSVEEWFYLTIPLALFCASILLRKLEKKKVVLATIIFYTLFFFVVRVVVPDYSITDNKYANFSVRMVAWFRLDAISYGVLIAYLNKFHYEWLMRISKRLLYTGIAGAVVLTGVHYMGLHPHFNFYYKSLAFRYFNNTLQLALIPLFFSFVIPYASALRSIKSKFATKVYTTISKVSYSMYLVHYTLIFHVMWHFIKVDKYNCIPYYLLYWAIVIGFSMFLFRFYELPMANLRDRFTSKETIR